jgi:hypothetical protein
MQARQRGVLLATLGLVVGCGDLVVPPPAPELRATAPMFDELGNECTPTMIICEDGSPPPPPEEVVDTFFELEGSASFSVSGESSAPSCPQGLPLLNTPATLLPPGEPPVHISSSGWAPIDYGGMPDPYARYFWPPNRADAEGYWPELGGTGRKAYIAIGLARCYYTLSGNTWTYHVSFYRYEGVKIRYPYRQSSSGGGSGGGAPPGCQTEYVVIEINNGSGWVVWWEGYATVC